MKAYILSFKPVCRLWQVSQDSGRHLLSARLQAPQASQLRNAKVESTGGTEQLHCNATGAHRSPLIYPSRGVSLYMRHPYKKARKAEGQLNTCAVFMKLLAFDGSSCLGGLITERSNPTKSAGVRGESQPLPALPPSRRGRETLQRPKCTVIFSCEATINFQWIDCASIRTEVGIGTATQIP